MPLFDAWSATAPTAYRGPADTEKVWNGVNPRGDITLGSLFYWADEEKRRRGELTDASVDDFSDCLSRSQMQSLDLPESWLVDDLVIGGEFTLVNGGSKTLKTTLCVAMGLHIANGIPFFGKDVKQCPALAISGESGKRVLRKTWFSIEESLRVRTPDDQFRLTTVLPRLASEEGLRFIEKRLDRFAPGLLIIDPAYLCLDGTDAANLFSMGQQLKPVNDLCVERGCTLMLLHHNTKAKSKTGTLPSFDAAAYAGFEQYLSGWMSVGRATKYSGRGKPHELLVSFGGRDQQDGDFHLEATVSDEDRTPRWNLEWQWYSEWKESKSRRKEKRDALSQSEPEDPFQVWLKGVETRFKGKGKFTRNEFRSATGDRANFSSRWDRLMELDILDVSKDGRSIKYEWPA